jgi:hypothetical protein
MRRLTSAIVALVLAGSACTGDTSGPTTTTSAAAASTTSTTNAPSTEATTSSTTTTTGPNPATDRLITRDLLELMPLERAGGSLSGFAVAQLRREDNVVAVTRLPSGSDEADDIERFGRQDGYRAVLRPARFTVDDVLALDSWVMLFASDAGAAGYLDDFAADVVKGEDAGHGADLRVVAADDFLVEEVGETAIGLILSEASVYGDTGFQETLIGFQIGRLLGFVSVLRSDDADFRIPTLFAAQDLEQRMLGVLDGTIVPVVEPEPAVLAAYRFAYSQTLSESYLRVVYPPPPEEDPGDGGEPPGDTPPGDSPPAGGSGAPPGENQAGDDGTGGEDASGDEAEGDEGSTTSTTTTTTTTLLVPTTDITTIDSTGVVLDPGGIDCTVQIGSDFGRERNRVIVVGNDAWRSTLAGGEGVFEEVDPDEESVASDLIYCPGWNPAMEISGVDLLVTPGLGEPSDWEDGSTVERFDLGRDALVTLGVAPEGGGGLDVDEFVVYLGGEEPWVVGVDLTFRGTTAEMEAALGPGFRARADIVITVKFRIVEINDPDLEVMAPDPDAVRS